MISLKIYWLVKLYLIFFFDMYFQRMYDIGARKFMFVGIGQIGCSPRYIIRKQNSKMCNEDVNQKIKPFSDNLPQKLQILKTQLSNSLFVTVQSFNYYNKIRKSPETYGEQQLNSSKIRIKIQFAPCIKMWGSNLIIHFCQIGLRENFEGSNWIFNLK